MSNLDCNEYLGFITRQMPSSVSTDEALAYMVSGCDVGFPVGRYVVIEDDGVKYLAKIVQSRVEDIYSIAKTPVISLEQELSMEVRYIPRFIALELIRECRGDACSPVTTPPQIHAKVRWARDGEVSKMLSLPSNGVELGYLALPSGEVLRSEFVKIPIDALKHHVLVVGTTGSGKTQLLKNMALDLVRNYSDCVVIAMDAVGHYHHLAMDNVETRVVIPMTNSLVGRLLRNIKVSEAKELAREFARRLVRYYLNEFYIRSGLKISGKVNIKVAYSREQEDAGKDKGYVVKVSKVIVKAKININNNDKEINVTLLPWALKSIDVMYRINDITGLLTEQAKLFYRRVINEVTDELPSNEKPTFKEIYEYLISPSNQSERGRTLVNYEAIANKLGIHPSTLENIVRAILSLVETRLFDVEHKAGDHKLVVKEPNYRELFKQGYVVVDLRTTSSLNQRIIVYRILNKLFRAMKPGGKRIAVVLVDEAHLFFPQTRDETEKRIIENQLTRIARLGRSRGIAVVFATHMPDDLNDAVLQLTNTKVILRSDERVLEKLGIPTSERRFLTVTDAGIGYVKSYAMKYPIYIKFEPKAFHLG
nr:ATP-binding protein [Caldivirga maquilingensis]